jgi:hypothetical protein
MVWLVWAKEIGLIVAIAATGTNRVMTSPDGINWTLRSAAAANQWYSVTWSPELSRFVAVSFSGTNNRVMTWDIPRGGTFIIDSNTRLGIGTTTPAQQLHVVGNTRIEGDLRLIGTENEYGWVTRTSAADNNWW